MRTFLLLLLAASPALADAIQCTAQPTQNAQPPAFAGMTAGDVIDFVRAAAPVVKVERVRQSALAVPTITLEVIRYEELGSAEHWRATCFEVLLHPSGEALDPTRLVRGTVPPSLRTRRRGYRYWIASALGLHLMLALGGEAAEWVGPRAA